MEEIDFEIDENIKVSNIFKNFQNKNIYTDIYENNDNKQDYNNLSKDFENNLNNSYNINNTLISTDEDFYMFDDKEVDDVSKQEKINSNTVNEKYNKENVYIDIDDNTIEKSSQKELNCDNDNIYNINHLNFNDENDFFDKEESKDTLLQSKNSFDIGNIYDRDYNYETIIFTASVDSKKEESQKNKIEKVEKVEHDNDNKNFYELNIDEIPDRKSLLEQIYKEDLTKSTEQNKIKKQKTKDIKILGKIFKRSEK